MKRKTSITKIASILTVLAMVWGGGVACQQPTEPEAPVEPTKYTITFDSQGGSEVAAQEVKEGAVATEPTTAPEKTGYTFGGWLNGEAAYDWTQPVTSDLSLTAKWTPTEYTITYHPEGVEKDTYIKSYTIESNAIVLDTNPTSPDATKPNFVAWHVDSEEGAVVTEIAKGSTGNKTFYAEFSAEVPCVVKFMLETEEVDSTKAKKGNKVTLPNGFEKYSLFSDADCTKPFDTNTAITADTTIYVELKTFTISYKVLPFNEEGSFSDIPYGKVITDEEINAFAVEIDGYTCKGIFTDEACTSPFDNTNAITSDLTVYVLYEEVVEVTNYSYVLENLNKEECSIPTTTEKNGGTFGLYYSDTGVAVNEGDKVYFQGTLTFNEALDAKQLYIQTNLNGWSNQAGQVWKDEGIDKGSYNFAVAYDVTAAESLTHVQIAIGSLVTENDDLKVTVKDFYVVHIAKENVEKVFPVVYSTTESPVVLNLKTGDGADGKTYETNINKNSVAFAAGDTIEFSIEIPKGADITGAQQVWMQTAADNWGWHSMLYSVTPYSTTADDLLGVVTATCSAAIDIDSINLNYGIQKKDADSSESFSLPITKVTLRKIPKFTSNK